MLEFLRFQKDEEQAWDLFVPKTILKLDFIRTEEFINGSLDLLNDQMQAETVLLFYL